MTRTTLHQTSTTTTTASLSDGLLLLTENDHQGHANATLILDSNAQRKLRDFLNYEVKT